jgi:DNA mismatch repair protein MutS
LATSRSLVVMDEIGRGTSTFDGLAIAWAVAEYIDETLRCRGLFATHYHELTALADGRKSVANWSVSAREHEGTLVFLHRLERGKSSRSYGVACAKLAGIPETVLARSGVLLAELEGRERRIARKVPQLSLFASAETAPAVPTPAGPEQALLQALRAVDPEQTTPLQALALLASWRKQYGVRS